MWIFLFALSFFAHNGIIAEEIEQSLTVKLATESVLFPLYLLPITIEQSSLSENYAKQLEKVLAFDLDHNGYTKISKRTALRDSIGQNGSFSQLGPLSKWIEQQIFYVVKIQIVGNEIKAVVLDVQDKAARNIDPLAITGDLSNDRRQMHRLADIIQKSLFESEGIASTRILYTIRTCNSLDSSKWISEVWEADYDGGNPRQITHDNSTAVNPVYLPSKPGYSTGTFLYVSYELGEPKICIASRKDGKKSRLMKMRGNQFMPAVSRQRDKVAFISDITGNPDLFIQPFDPEKGAIGKPQQIFAAPRATQGSPTFSPDGKRIAFVSNKDGSPKIYVMEILPPGAELKEIKANMITRANRENSAPAWSPDGTKIAYCAKGKGDRQIWIYDFTTNKETQVTEGNGHKENPTWASNSLHLMYNSSDPRSSELYMVNLNELEPVRITFGPGEKRFPNWEK